MFGYRSSASSLVPDVGRSDGKGLGSIGATICNIPPAFSRGRLSSARPDSVDRREWLPKAIARAVVERSRIGRRRGAEVSSREETGLRWGPTAHASARSAYDWAGSPGLSSPRSPQGGSAIHRHDDSRSGVSVRAERADCLLRAICFSPAVSGPPRLQSKD